MNLDNINNWIEEKAFQWEKYIYDGSILWNNNYFQFHEFDDKFQLTTISMRSQINSILSEADSIYHWFCHQISSTVLQKLLSNSLVNSWEIYTGNDPKIRYKNHSLLVVEMLNWKKWVIDLALDIDIIVPIDNQWHTSHLFKSHKKYRASLDSVTGKLLFTIYIPKREKLLEYSMLPTSDESYMNSLKYSLALSQKWMVRSKRTQQEGLFETWIEFITDFPEMLNRILLWEKDLEVNFKK